MGVLDFISNPIKSTSILDFISQPIEKKPQVQLTNPFTPTAHSTPQTTTPGIGDAIVGGVSKFLTPKPLAGHSAPFNFSASAATVASTPPRTVRSQDFKDVGNLPLTLSGYAGAGGIVSLAEVILKKPIAINAPFPHMDENNKPIEEPLRGAQASYFNQIEKGIPESQAFANAAIQTVWDMAIIAPTVKNFAKLAALKTIPEKLMTDESIISATRQQMRDFSQGVIKGESPLPIEIQKAFQAASTEVKKNMLLGSGIDIVKAKPSLLGKMLGVTEAEINTILGGSGTGTVVRPGSAGALPGQRDIPGQAPAFGLSTRRVEGVGYTDNTITKIALSKNADEIAGFLSSNVDLPVDKIPLVSRILAGLNDPEKIKTVISNVLPSPEQILGQKQVELELLKDQIESNPLNENTRNDRLLFDSKEKDIIELGDAKGKRARFIETRMAEAGYSNPQKFVDDYQALQEQRAQLKALQAEVKVLKAEGKGVFLSDGTWIGKNMGNSPEAIDRINKLARPQVNSAESGRQQILKENTQSIQEKGGQVLAPEKSKELTTFMSKTGGFLTESDVPKMYKEYGNISIAVKDVNGQRARMSIEDFQKLSQNKAFSDRIRAVFVGGHSYELNRKPDFDPQFMEALNPKKLLENKSTTDGFAKLGTLEDIGGVKLTADTTISKSQQALFVQAITDGRVRTLLKENGIKEVNIQPPYKFGLSEQGHIVKGKQIINISADATDPQHTILHEIGHEKLDNLPVDKQNVLLDRAKNTTDPEMQGYKSLGVWEEIVADSLYNNPDFAPEYYGGQKVISTPKKYSAEGIPLSTKAQEARIANRPPVEPPRTTLPELPPEGETPKFVAEPQPEVPTSALGFLKRNLNPLKFINENTAEIFRDWNSGRITGRELANETARTIKIEGDGMDLIHKYQAGENVPQKEQIQKIFDDLRDEAISRGIEVPYRKNYIPQVYKGGPRDIQKAILDYLSEHGVHDEMAMDYVNGVKPLPDEVASRLKLSTSFEKERVFANYRTAQEYGLKPKYDKISDLAAHYRGELEKAITNRKLIDDLKADGSILPDKYAPKEWQVLNTQFTGNAGTYRAPANVAKVVNDIFSDPNLGGLLSMGAKTLATASKMMQEIVLSAGLPNTTINFFAIGQLIKEITAGNFKAVNAFIRANLNSATAKYFTAHEQTIMDMAKENIDITNRIGTFGQQSMLDLLKDKEFKKLIGHGLDIAFGKKTFESFMPMMQIQLFEDIVKATGNKKLAGQVVRANFGLNTDSFARGELTQDVLSAVFFAPRFRESIIRSLFNTGKSGWEVLRYIGTAGGKKIDPGLSRNIRLLVGMILTYGIYNVINKQQTGHYMWDNPTGRNFALGIPRDNGEIIYVEFMPSYLAFARNMATGAIATGKGDFSMATQKFGTVFSMPVKLISELVSKSDYFGNPIYEETDTGLEKIHKMAAYAGLSVNHPYIKEAVSYLPDSAEKFITGKNKDPKPLYQSLVVALELPLKFSTKDKESTSAFHDALDAKTKENATIKKKYVDLYEKNKKLDAAGKSAEADANYKALTKEEKVIYKEIVSNEKSRATVKREGELYDLVVSAKKLDAEGKSNEADALYNNLSKEDKRIYKLVVNRIKTPQLPTDDVKQPGIIKKTINALFGVKVAEASYAGEQPTKNYSVRNNEISDIDLEEARAVLFGEISNRSSDKQKLEAQTILNTAINRMEVFAKRGAPKTLTEVLQMDNQYQAYQSKQYEKYKSGKLEKIDMQKIEAIEAIINKVKDGTFQNNIGDYVYYAHKPDGRIFARAGRLFK